MLWSFYPACHVCEMRERCLVNKLKKKKKLCTHQTNVIISLSLFLIQITKISGNVLLKFKKTLAIFLWIFHIGFEDLWEKDQIYFEIGTLPHQVTLKRRKTGFCLFASSSFSFDFIMRLVIMGWGNKSSWITMTKMLTSASFLSRQIQP